MTKQIIIKQSNKRKQKFNLMGNYSSKQQELQYHSQYESQLYGKGTIFSSNKVPICYIIKTIKLIDDENIFKLYQQIQNNQNIYLLSLYGYVLGKSCECDQQSVMKKCVLTYWEFLSFSLKDCIYYRKRISLPFRQDQIWHIIKAAIFGYNSFERMNVYYEFKEDQLLVNHEGRVRLSWQHILGKNQHIKYYKIEKEFRRLLQQQKSQYSSETRGSISTHHQGNNFRNSLWSKIVNQQQYYSPQQLHSIANFEFTRKLNFSQCNTFSLGMMLLHVCTLQNPINLFYNYFAVDYGKINYIMVNHLSKTYSEHLLTLIGQMLNQNPFQRIAPQTVREKYAHFMRGEFEINMNVNPELKRSFKSRHLV